MFNSSHSSTQSFFACEQSKHMEMVSRLAMSPIYEDLCNGTINPWHSGTSMTASEGALCREEALGRHPCSLSLQFRLRAMGHSTFCIPPHRVPLVCEQSKHMDVVSRLATSPIYEELCNGTTKPWHSGTSMTADKRTLC